MSTRSDEFSIRGRRFIDPFNRFGCNISPVVVVVEFCQIVGPRPLKVFYTDEEDARRLDMDSLSVWLMSCETTSGTVMMIYNQQTAIHALSYYFVMHDIRARAFQRQFCVAYLSSTKLTGETLKKFSLAVRKAATPVIVCNRRLFLRQLTDMLKIADGVVNDSLHDYYTLDAEALKFSTTRKVQNIAEEARRLRPRMEAVKNLLDKSENDTTDCHGHSVEDLSAGERMLLQLNAQQPLCQFEDLAPCTSIGFLQSMDFILSHVSERERRRGVLYSCGTPILRFPKYSSPIKEHACSLVTETAKNEETLKTITQHLDNLLYPVLAGEDMKVCGSEQRKDTVIDMVDKLNFLRPKSHSNHSFKHWDSEVRDEKGHKGIYGKLASRSQSRSLIPTSPSGVALQSSSTSESPTVIFDLNESRLLTCPYSGVLLSSLKTKKRFPSDDSLIQFIAAQISGIGNLLYLSRFVNPLGIRNENLSPDDIDILVNLLYEIDIVKYEPLKTAYDKKRVKTPMKAIPF
ncbi:hypothetical protein WR25_20127 isoform A [Diploscapter pachys]|uniref:UDENN FLCN/SMCR8-type domain-containing protein n=2 Tax=Diploscapter pachys TaxID=2018661 RepID=A0A2A2M048_9BILA|nr:hypothetical protein WR25_20127 isoform A [Diploscapter pachys]